MASEESLGNREIPFVAPEPIKIEPPERPTPLTVPRVSYEEILDIYEQMGLSPEEQRQLLKQRGINDPVKMPLESSHPVTINEYMNMYEFHHKNKGGGEVSREAKIALHRELAGRGIYNVNNLTGAQMNMPLPEFVPMDPRSIDRLATHNPNDFPNFVWKPGERAERAAAQSRVVPQTKQMKMVSEVKLYQAYMNKHKEDFLLAEYAADKLVNPITHTSGDYLTKKVLQRIEKDKENAPIISDEARELATKTWIAREKLAEAKGIGSRTGIGMGVVTGVADMLLGDVSEPSFATEFTQWAMRAAGLDTPEDPKRFVETDQGRQALINLSDEIERDAQIISDGLYDPRVTRTKDGKTDYFPGITVDAQKLSSAARQVFSPDRFGATKPIDLELEGVSQEDWNRGIDFLKQRGTKKEKQAVARMERLQERARKLLTRSEHGSFTEWAMSEVPQEGFYWDPDANGGRGAVRSRDFKIDHERYAYLSRGWMNTAQAAKRKLTFGNRALEEAREIASGLAGAVQLFMAQTEGIDQLAELVASGQIQIDDAKYEAMLQGYKKGTPMFGGIAAYFAPFVDSFEAVADQASAQPIDTILNMLPFYFAMRGLSGAYRGYKASKDIDRLIDAGLTDEATATKALEIGEKMLKEEQKVMLRRWMETADGKLFNSMLESSGISKLPIPEALTGAMKGAALGAAFGIPGDPAFYATAMGSLQGAGHLINKSPFLMRVLDDATTSRSAVGQQISDDAVQDLESLSGLQSELMLEFEHSTRGGVKRYVPIKQRTAEAKAAELNALSERGLIGVDAVIDHAANFRAMVDTDPGVVAARENLNSTPLIDEAGDVNPAHAQAKREFEIARANATVRIAETIESETGVLFVPYREENFANEVTTIMRDRELAAKQVRDTEAALASQLDEKVEKLRERGETMGAEQLARATERQKKGQEQFVKDNSRAGKQREADVNRARKESEKSLRDLNLQKERLKAPIRKNIRLQETQLKRAKASKIKEDAKAKAAYDEAKSLANAKIAEARAAYNAVVDDIKTKLPGAIAREVNPSKRKKLRQKAKARKDKAKETRDKRIKSQKQRRDNAKKRRDKSIESATKKVDGIKEKIRKLKADDRGVKVRYKGKRRTWTEINKMHQAALNEKVKGINKAFYARRDELLRKVAEQRMDVRVAQARMNRAINDELLDVDLADDAVLPPRDELPTPEQSAAQAARQEYDSVVAELRRQDELDQRRTQAALEEITKVRAAEYERAINSAFGVHVDDGNYVLQVRETVTWDDTVGFREVEPDGLAPGLTTGQAVPKEASPTGRSGIVEYTDTPVGTELLAAANLPAEDLPKIFGMLTRYVDEIVELIESLGDIDAAKDFLAGSSPKSVRSALKAKRPRITTRDGKVSVQFVTGEKWAENVISSIGSRLSGSGRNFAKRLLLEIYGDLILNQQSRTLLLDNSLRERFTRYASQELTKHLNINTKKWGADIRTKVEPMALSFANGRTFESGTGFGRVTYQFLDSNGAPIRYTRPDGQKGVLNMENLFGDFMLSKEVRSSPKELARSRAQAFGTALTAMSYGAENRIVADALFRSLNISDDIWRQGTASTAYRQSVYDHYVKNGTLPEIYKDTIVGGGSVLQPSFDPVNMQLIQNSLRRNPESPLTLDDAVEGLSVALDSDRSKTAYVAVGGSADKSKVQTIAGSIGERPSTSQSLGVARVHSPLQPEHIGGPQQRITAPNATRTMDGQQAPTTGDTVYVNQDTSSALGWALGTNPDDIVNKSAGITKFLVGINTVWKWGRTAGSFIFQNPATNFTSNVVSGMMNRGTDPITAWRQPIQAGGLWERYATGSLDGTHRGVQMDALVRTGFKNQAQLIAEIDQVRQALHVNGDASVWATRIDDLVRGGKIPIPKNLRAKIGKDEITIKSYRDLAEFQDYLYKTFGDELHKLNDAIIQMDRNEALISKMKPNQSITFSNLDSGGGFGDAPAIGSITKTDTGYLVVRSRGRKKRQAVRVDSLEAPEAMDLLASASMGHANSLYYNLSKTGTAVRIGRSLEAMMMSPFLSWMFKSLDIPMIKKGMFYRMFADDIYQISTDPLVNLDIYMEAAKRAARRALVVTAIKDQEFDSSAIRKTLPGWAASAIISGSPDRDINFFLADSSMPIGGFIGFLEFLNAADKMYHRGERQLVEVWQYKDDNGEDNFAYQKSEIPPAFRGSAVKTQISETIDMNSFWKKIDPNRETPAMAAAKRLVSGGMVTRLLPIFNIDPLTQRPYEGTEDAEYKRYRDIFSIITPNMVLYGPDTYVRYLRTTRGILRYEDPQGRAYSSMKNAGDRTMSVINAMLARNHKRTNPLWLAKFGTSFVSSIAPEIRRIIKKTEDGTYTEADARSRISLLRETGKAYVRWVPRFSSAMSQRAQQVGLYDDKAAAKMMKDVEELRTAHTKGIPDFNESLIEAEEAGFGMDDFYE